MDTRATRIAMQLLKTLGVILAIILTVTLFVYFAIPVILSVDWPDWTGFNTYTKPDGTFEREKTLWDWMELLIIPLVLAIGGYLFRQAEKRTDEEIAERRRKQEQKIADDRRQQEQEIADDRRQQEQEIAETRRQQEQEIANYNLQETALQTYLDRMSELLLTNNTSTLEANTKVQSLARARTLTIAYRLHPMRKRALLLFLHESNLINKNAITVNLEGADLKEAWLERANLQEANLSRVSLRTANLKGANLQGANLKETILEGANLEGANLDGANLTGAFLLQANLTGASLNGTNLTDADLEAANLTGAFLLQANLTGTFLKDASLRAANLAGAIYTNRTRWPNRHTVPANTTNIDQQPDS